MGVTPAIVNSIVGTEFAPMGTSAPSVTPHDPPEGDAKSLRPQLMAPAVLFNVAVTPVVRADQRCVQLPPVLQFESDVVL